MFKIIILGASLSIAAAAGATITTSQPVSEEIEAHREEMLIIHAPIAGIENHFWFDYRINVEEARKELSSDLGRASDMEDLRDGWDEYRGELANDRAKYVEQMAKRGYRQPTVNVIE